MTNKAPMQIVGSGSPLERIATDILEELPETDNGKRYILVIADYFTKWTECFAMPNMESKTVATKIVKEVITRTNYTRIKVDNTKVNSSRRHVSYLTFKRHIRLPTTCTHSTVRWYG